ncbi:hypothetical protein [Glaciihabitans sp. dw_435]|uniref:hypothetical protein n=1 Tax=Glaciihabitans sp. dw_435 TaxID=2720081 RepID=UPI001BD21742|nr:hypothetical protein [Glaciihabitans sp. dw_435]
MSAATLQAIEDAIAAHHRDTTDADQKPERFRAVISAWVVGYEISNIVQVDGDAVIGYANDYIASDSSPNTLSSVSAWVSSRIGDTIAGADDPDD